MTLTATAAFRLAVVASCLHLFAYMSRLLKLTGSVLNMRADLTPEGRKGSFIGVRRQARQEMATNPDGEPPPTNEAVAQAVQEKVAVRLIAFVAALYLQNLNDTPGKLAKKYIVLFGLHGKESLPGIWLAVCPFSGISNTLPDDFTCNTYLAQLVL